MRNVVHVQSRVVICLVMHCKKCFVHLLILNRILFFDWKNKSLTICNLTPWTASLSPSLSLSICTVNISFYLHAQTAPRHDNKRSSLIYQKTCLIYWHLKCLLATKIIPMPNSLCKAWLLFTVMRLILVLWVIMMGRPVQPYISMHWMSCGTWCPVTAR